MGSCVSSLLPDNATANPTPGQGTSMLKKNNKKKRRKNGKLKGKGRLFSRFAGSTDFSKVQIGGGNGGRYNEDELHRLTERMFLNGASEKACLFTQQGRKGTNQDAMLVWENFASKDDTIFCGVFDGHGPYGHMVAKKVRDALPLKLYDQWQSITDGNNSQHQNDSVKGSSNSEETASVGVGEEWFEPVDISEGDNLPEIYSVLRKSLLRSFKLMDKELKLHETIDCFCSGSTAVTIVQQGHDLVIGNVGDSRAVLATRLKDNSLVPLQLTVDLKPNLPREAARIQQCKGRVFALQDEPEVARVWLPNNDSPGLAMARAFGDFCLKDYGLIAVPDISYHRITEIDEFVVLATDGVWDVLSNKEVVDVVASAPTRSTAARALVDCAVRAWRLKFPTSKTDDCAVICLFLHPADQQLQVSVAEELSTESGEMDFQGLTDTGKTNILESDASAVPSDSRNPVTPGSADEITHVTEIKEGNLKERSQSTRCLADCISTAEEEEWSALEGVTRVNSLLNLPRFSDDDKNSRNKKK